MDTDARTQMVLDRMAYDGNPEGFVASVDGAQEELRGRLEAARALLPRVKVARDIKLKIRWVEGPTGLGAQWWGGVLRHANHPPAPPTALPLQPAVLQPGHRRGARRHRAEPGGHGLRGL